MGEEIFRKKSIDRIKSPEALDDYVRVSNPGVWLLLAAVIALLVGAFIWSAFGRIDSVVPGKAIVIDGKVICYIDEERADEIELGMPVKIGESSGIVRNIDTYSDREDTCRIIAEVDVPDGQYEAEIVTESISPMSFIFN